MSAPDLRRLGAPAAKWPATRSHSAIGSSPRLGNIRRLWSPRVPARALVDFTRGFAVMLQARLSLVDALTTAATQCRHAGLRGILETVRSDVERGRSLSESLARHGRVFDPFYVHLAHVGEVAGILDVVLLRLAGHLEKAGALKRKIRFALFYPGLILTVATGAIFFFLTTIVPTFAEMYTDFGHELPGPTQVVLRLSRALTTYAPTLFGVGLVLAAGTVWWLRTPGGRLAWDRFKLRMPAVGTLLRRSLTARVCRTLATLLSSGVALDEALSIQVKAAGNRYAEQVLEDVVARVRRGSSLHEPLQASGLVPDMVVHLIAVGERTAELDGMLAHAAAYYEDEVDTLIDGLTSVIEPVLIIAIGCILGGILVALYLPMFELINTVG